MIARYSSVAVDSRGRIFISHYRYSEISVFDSSGTFVRTLGREGEGPGEYRSVVHINAGPRYIHVFDFMGRTLLDYDFDVVRVDRFGADLSDSFITDSGDIIFTGDVPTAASAGHTLHILRPSGEMASFGGDHQLYEGGAAEHSSAITGGAGVAWVVEKYPNRLIRWNLAREPRASKGHLDKFHPSTF